MHITQKELKEILRYCPETGKFYWKVKKAPRIKIGQEAGYKNPGTNYIVIGIDGKIKTAHRLAWLYMLGEFPEKIDHKNGNRTDNRWANLRLTNNSENQQNQRNCHADKKSCNFLGVTYRKNRKKPWRSKITKDGIIYHLGYFDTAEKAYEAYLLKKRELHPACTI